MRIETEGFTNRYLVESLALLFFPGVRFGGDEDDGLAARCALTSRDGVTTANSAVTVNGRCETETESIREPADKRKRNELIGRTFWLAAKRLTGVTPPWGIMTGIRPAKYARECLEAGMTEAEITEKLIREDFMREDKIRLLTDIARTEIRFDTEQARRELSLYVSIPFCPSRCSYCSFVAFSIEKAHKLIPRYLELLCEELRELGAFVRERGLCLRTVYIGGGTPTTLTAEQLRILCDALHSSFDFSGVTEFTVEAGRPDTFTAEKALVLRDAGVGRLSINPQSMNDEILRGVGRRHTEEQFREAFAAARAVGGFAVNSDLIAGLPGETPELYMASMRRLLTLAPENVTVHTLCMKRASDLKRDDKEYFLEPHEIVPQMLEKGAALLRASGYAPYYLYRQKNALENLENVGYAKPGFEGQYNIFMMAELHTVLAAGAGAVTKLVDREKNRIERIFCPKYPYEYIDRFAEMTAENRRKLDGFFESVSPQGV